jgi:FtsH-binding integral membrane protein
VSDMYQHFGNPTTAWAAPIDARMAFVRRTYVHLAAAVALFVAVSAAFYAAHVGERLTQWMTSGGMLGFILFFVGIMAVTMGANALALRSRSQSLQYAGLATYAVALAFWFSPLLTFAVHAFPGAHLLETAAGLTLLAFGGLTAFVLMSKKDLSFLGPMLGIAGLVVLGVFAAGLIFGFSLGLWYTAAMIAFAVGAILYDTSNVLHRYRTDQHVGAAIALFASVIMLFVWVLQLLMELQGRRR